MKSTEALVVEAGGLVAALPLEGVAEIMRPRPFQPVAGAPPGVQGVARIRGQAVPVVSLATLLEGSPAPAERLVLLRFGERSVALEVARVRGIRSLRTEPLPPLLEDAHEAVSALSRLDRDLVLLLRASKLLPEESNG